jgi:hypothetical protein
MMPATVSGLEPAANPKKPPLPAQGYTFPTHSVNIGSQENQEKPGIDKYVALVHSCEKS